MGSAVQSPVAVVGTGVAGLVTAFALSEAGFPVEVFERSDAPFSQAASRLAGGMIAPFCEGETADEIVVQLGQEAHAFWKRAVPEVIEKGTLVVGTLTQQHLYEKSTSNLMEVKSRGGYLMGLTNYGNCIQARHRSYPPTDC